MEEGGDVGLWGLWGGGDVGRRTEWEVAVQWGVPAL